jgi:hypothetical protein
MPALTISQHLHVDRFPSIALPEGHPGGMSLQGFLDHLVQRHVLKQATWRDWGIGVEDN